MNEPTIKIKVNRTQRIYVVEGELLIVTPERARTLQGFCTAATATEAAPAPEDRIVRGKKSK